VVAYLGVKIGGGDGGVGGGRWRWKDIVCWIQHFYPSPYFTLSLSLSLSLVWVSYTVAVIYFCLVGAEFSVLKYDERTGCNSARLERW
jgi:hypothetical protein